MSNPKRESLQRDYIAITVLVTELSHLIKTAAYALQQGFWQNRGEGPSYGASRLFTHAHGSGSVAVCWIGCSVS